MIEIIPAILTNSADEFEKIIRQIEPYTTRAHLDIADGIFVPNETIKGYPELERTSTSLKFDIHLMVKDPLKQLDEWDNKEIADRFIIHIESDNVSTAIEMIKKKRKNVGLALNHDTPVNILEAYVNSVDFVQFMTINPGFQGRDFQDNVVETIKVFHKKYPEIVLAVDGGINLATAKIAIEAGASILVSGSFIIKSGKPGKAIEELRKISENK